MGMAQIRYERVAVKVRAYRIIDAGRWVGTVRCRANGDWVASTPVMAAPAERSRREATAALLGLLAEREAS